MIEKELAWQRIRQIAEEQAFITAKVESARPAGLIVKVFDSIQGFVPGSHTLEVPSSITSAAFACKKLISASDGVASRSRELLCQL